MDIRNNYIVSKAFKNFLLASILTSVIQQMRVIVDGVIVSHLISPEAMTAINLYFPLEDVVYALIMTFILGGGFYAAVELGKQHYRRMSEFLIVAFLASITLVIIMVLVLYAKFPWLIQTLSDDSMPYICQLTADYTQIMLLTFIVMVPNGILRTFVCIDGKPRLVTISILVSFTLNIVLDITMIYVFDMGIKGAALATLVSDIVGMFMLVFHLFQRGGTFILSWAKDGWHILVETIKYGIPFSLWIMLEGVMIYILNRQVIFFTAWMEHT